MGTNGKLPPHVIYSIQQDVDVTRRLTITLNEGITVQQAVEEPAALKNIIAAPHTKISRGDFVTLVSKDGRQVADSCPVLKADGSGIRLGTPPAADRFRARSLVRR